jgi:hypothetical protein
MKMDLKESKPYGRMGHSCRTREPAEKHIRWKFPSTDLFGDNLHKVGVLRRGLVESAAELWRKAYPEVCGSPHEFLLDPNQYERLIALEETWEEDSLKKVYCMSVVEEVATGKVVAATLLTKYEGNLQVEFSFAATHPDYRRRDLTDELRRFTRMIALSSGAEYLTTFCETWHDITQNWCIRGGWRIAGIFPGNFIRWNGEGQEYRGCTVHFYRFANKGEEHATKPEEWHLAPEVREVWEAIDRVNQKIEDVYEARINKEMMRSCALSP